MGGGQYFWPQDPHDQKLYHSEKRFLCGVPSVDILCKEPYDHFGSRYLLGWACMSARSASALDLLTGEMMIAEPSLPIEGPRKATPCLLLVSSWRLFWRAKNCPAI